MPRPNQPVVKRHRQPRLASKANADKLATAVALHQQGQLDQAEVIYREIVQAQPRHFDALQLLATIAAQRRESATAVELFEKVLAIDPEHASSFNNRGNALLDLKRHIEALASYDAAIRIEPDYVDALYNRGNTLLAIKRPEQALQGYERVLAIKPDHAEALSNRGKALQELQRHEEALQSVDRALAIKPDYQAALSNRGNVLLALKRYDDALASYDSALALNPDYAEVHLNRAIVRLLQGDFGQGWPEYEWRWHSSGIALPRLTKPRWSGEPLQGRTILLYAEQGLGDTLQFVRYGRLLRRQGARVIVCCQKPLVALLQRCEGIDELVARGEQLPEFDYWSPLMSIPGVLRTDLDLIPGECGYLSADPALVAHWETRLAAFPGFRIAIVWQGSPGYQENLQRSIPLESFRQLAQLPGVQLISLQKNPDTTHIAEADSSFEIIQFENIDTISGSFMDSAAILENVDLTITCDTSMVHLAGALGVPVWLAASVSPDWRWLLNRDDSPWYPSLRLFRQQAAGDWSEVLQRITHMVRTQLDVATTPIPVTRQAGATSHSRQIDEGLGKATTITIELSPGELLDRVTILEIKSELILEDTKLQNVLNELNALNAVRDAAIQPSMELTALTRELKQINENLWHIEDAIRECERHQNFGTRFVELARSVYQSNDHRSTLKRQINELLGSRLIEEKSYIPY